MNNIEEMKKKYGSGDYKLLKKVKHLTNGWKLDTFMPFIAYNGHDITEDNFRLIHKKHEEVLNAWLEDNNVEIEWSQADSAWRDDKDFIKDYLDTFNYRLKSNQNGEFEYVTDTDVGEEKEDETKKITQEKEVAFMEMEAVKQNVNSTCPSNFGFEPKEGVEILEKILGGFIGFVIDEECDKIGCVWNEIGIELYQDCKIYNLTPKKVEWYLNKDNFPCLVKNTNTGKFIVLRGGIHKNYKTLIDDSWVLATKEEALKLIVEVE